MKQLVPWRKDKKEIGNSVVYEAIISTTPEMSGHLMHPYISCKGSGAFQDSFFSLPTPIHVLRPLQLVGEGLPQVRPGMASIVYRLFRVLGSPLRVALSSSMDGLVHSFWSKQVMVTIKGTGIQ